MAANRSGTEALGTRLAEDQLRVLEENFSRGGRNPDEATLALIAAECGLSEEETRARTHSYRPDRALRTAMLVDQFTLSQFGHTQLLESRIRLK
ncbi:Homeodomain-only protein [Bagarius yarrelli]|uniref:Homeodomain-only protein n=1 Tax=Bagarius yarrelli TaxID=175774 RepID=A0A556TVN6_BAGYA|nr:Homeodomain-only protein [Bagarius yarrelli]